MCVRFGGNDAPRIEHLALKSPIRWELQSWAPLLCTVTVLMYEFVRRVVCYQCLRLDSFCSSFLCSHNPSQQSVNTQQP